MRASFARNRAAILCFDPPVARGFCPEPVLSLPLLERRSPIPLLCMSTPRAFLLGRCEHSTHWTCRLGIMDTLYCDFSQKAACLVCDRLLWLFLFSFHHHPQLSCSISNPSTFYPLDHGHGVTRTWSAVMFSKSMQGKRAGVQLVPVTSGFTQTAEHRPGGLPSPDKPSAQRRCRTSSGLCSVLPFQGAQPLQLQHPTLHLASRHRARAPVSP